MTELAAAIPATGDPVELVDVDAHRDHTLALRDVSLSIPAGTLTAVIGPNGAGKSTLFGLISGRLRASNGTVTVQGTVAEVLQATAVDPDLPLSVEDAVRIGRYPAKGLLRRLDRADRDAVEAALEAVDLHHLRRRRFSSLSGGQRQRVLVAQGLAQEASVLVLDEPAAGLDQTSQQRILQLMRAQADAGRTVLFSTHQLSDAGHADVVVALSCDCVCCAPPEAALTDPTVTRLFERPQVPVRSSAPVAVPRA